MSDTPHVIMLAAENGAIPNAKVGGIADVIEAVPRQLNKKGVSVTVVIPSHGFLHQLPDSHFVQKFEFQFSGQTQVAELFEFRGIKNNCNQSPNDSAVYTRQLIVDHPQIKGNSQNQLYLSDPPERPFAQDASRFACFSAACAALLEGDSLQQANVIHLHDWHVGYVAILKNSGRYPVLAQTRTVLTIHNLAYQGIRPMYEDESAFDTWFPDTQFSHEAIRDPRWPWCVNPLAAAIRLCDAVHVVSPSYAEEIQHKQEPEIWPGADGCGLEGDLRVANEQHRLHGILNGCDYDAVTVNDTVASEQLDAAWVHLHSILSEQSDDNVHKILSHYAGARPRPLATSVGRLTEQKVALFLQALENGTLAIDALLDELGNDGLFILLGSGDPELENVFNDVAARHENFLFLCTFSNQLADALYRSGDLFLMPSTFEPCGISQMLAMRAGQPCLVHAVGGLKDTVSADINGFHFSGSSREHQAKALVSVARNCFDRYRDVDSGDWRSIRDAAQAARFYWDDSVSQYLNQLYAPAIS